MHKEFMTNESPKQANQVDCKQKSLYNKQHSNSEMCQRFIFCFPPAKLADGLFVFGNSDQSQSKG